MNDVMAKYIEKEPLVKAIKEDYNNRKQEKRKEEIFKGLYSKVYCDGIENEFESVIKIIEKSAYYVKGEICTTLEECDKMDEFINKQDVIGYLNGYLYSSGEGGSFNRGQRRALTNVIQAISTVKKADVQPVKHGRWIGIYEYCEKNGYIPSGMGIYHWCSECDKAEHKTSDFCPNCGARMDGNTVLWEEKDND